MPAFDLSVMAIRAEESAWFDVAYLGSAGAFGLLDPACLSTPRSDNGQTLEATLQQQGFDPQADPRTAPPAGSGRHPGVPRAAHRAGPDAGRSRGCPPPSSAASADASGSATRAAPATTPTREPCPAPTGRMRSQRPSRCCTTWRPCGCNRKRRARIWCSPRVSSSPTRPAWAEQDRRRNPLCARPAQPVRDDHGCGSDRGARGGGADRCRVPRRIRPGYHQRFARRP